jgi:hypothetical protein
LFVATAADLEDAAGSEEPVQRRYHLRARQPILGSGCGVQPFPFSAGASWAEDKLALIARLAEFAQAERLITARGPCAA